MRTTPHDAHMLALALLAIAAGLALLAAGIILDPPTALLRRLHKEN
jgi:hypothetical protein